MWTPLIPQFRFVVHLHRRLSSRGQAINPGLLVTFAGGSQSWITITSHCLLAAV